MKITTSFILGLLVGMTGLYFYNRSVTNPSLIQQTCEEAIAEVKEQIEQDLTQESRTLFGTVKALSGDEITLEVEQSNGVLITYNILTDTNTTFARIINDEASTKERVTLREIKIDSRITVTAIEPVDSLNVYAKEIISL